MLQTIAIDQVKEALDQFSKGQKYLYNTLTTTIKDNQTNEIWLIHLFEELRDNVDLFENLNEQFLDFLQLHIDWTKQSKIVLNTFGAFQMNLISYYTKHTQRYLSFLFTLFTIPDYSTGCLPLHEFAHETLHHLVRIVPLASTVLPQIVEQHFPFMTKDLQIQVIYIKNILRTLSYLPDQRLRFLEIILSKLLRLDVHASRQDILREEKSTVENELVFSLEQLDTNDHQNSNVMKHDQADKLDCLILILFEYITSICIQNGRTETVNYEEAKSLFRDLLNIFNKILLPTHDSSHVQFLIFYICSFHTDFSDEFMNNCWKTFVSPSVTMTFRQASSCYLCSFIARAKFIPIKSALNITQLMVEWLHAYVSTAESNCTNANPNRHLPFYSICQAIFYIFVYRHQEIARLSDGIDTVLKWRIGRIISSELNPLKYCLPAITLRFAQLARNYQIVFCYSIIETNNRYSLPETYSINENLSSTILYSYFPFDPYVLKRSLAFIQPIYNDYRDDNDEINLPKDSDDIQQQDNDDGNDALTSMMMSTTPDSTGSFDQYSMSASLKASRNTPSCLPFDRSPGFRNLLN